MKERADTKGRRSRKVAGLAMETAKKPHVTQQCQADDGRAIYDQFLKEAGDQGDGSEES
ncbi:MAG: hypothetical protein ACLTLQ_15660 [[Clostridium] scindens]